MRWTPDVPERAAWQAERRRFRGRSFSGLYARRHGHDQELAGRIRPLIGSDPELTEKKMFGGLAFLIRGNMAIAANSDGGAMVRVDPA